MAKEQFMHLPHAPYKTLCSFLASLFLLTGIQAQEPPLCVVTQANQHAIRYVGNSRPQNGRMQLELLLREGLQKEHYVLEIGCGALVAGIPIMSMVEIGHYVGIEPNKWLIDASLQVPQNYNIALQQQPLFLYNEFFDAESTGISFDYIISHSIISHAAHWQLPLFLEMCSRVLKKDGKVIFSLRLTEPNQYGNRGAKEESRSEQWVYPGNSYFHKETVIEEASKWFSKVELKPEFTRIITSSDATAFHDWFVLTK